jgi:transposase
MSNRGHPIELRQRVVSACLDKGMSQEEAAEVFDVGEASVYRWLRLQRETGSLEPRPHGGGQPPAFDEQEHELLKRVVAEKPDRTLADLTVEICSRIKKAVSESAIVRGLKRLGITLKKKSSRRARRIGQTSRKSTRRISRK